jgi:hypothetical protein
LRHLRDGAVPFPLIAVRPALPQALANMRRKESRMDGIPLGPGFGAELRAILLADIAFDDAASAAARGAREALGAEAGRSYFASVGKGGVVMWDSRATMHRDRPSREARLMIRTTSSAAEADGVATTRLPSCQAAE